MSILYFLILLICFPRNSSCETITLLDAINYVLTNFFNNTAPLLDIIIETTSNAHPSMFNDLLEEVLKIQWNFRVQLDINNKNNQSVGDFNLLFIDSYEAFRRILPVIDDYHGNTPIYFLIVLKTAIDQKILTWIEEIFSDLFNRMLDNVNVLTEINGEVQFYTYFPYQQSYCQSTKPIRVSQNSTTSLEKFNFFPNKFQNIHGCTLRVLTRNFLFGRKIRYFQGLPESWGIEWEILNVLKSKMNFKEKFIRAIVYDHLEVLANGTAFGSYKLLKNGKADIMIGFYRHGPLQDLIFSTSVSYFNNWIVIAMFRPPAEFLKFSWLFAPFHHSVWSCTIILLIIASACISFVSNTEGLVENLDLYPNRPNIFNSFAIAIGMTIAHLPMKNFLRVCFMIWSFGLLTIRSIYQGKMFDSYRTMIPTTTRLTVTQLLAEHYTIHMQTAYFQLFKNFSGIDSIKYVELTTDRKLNQALTRDSAVIDSFLYFYLTHNQSELANIVMEPLFTEHICIFYQAHSSMAQIIDMILLRMIEGGLLLRWKEHFEKLKNINFTPRKYSSEIGPITVERFKYILILFSVFYILAGVVFVIEFLWKRIYNLCLRLKAETKKVKRYYCYKSRATYNFN